jgi:hypothetical protein
MVTRFLPLSQNWLNLYAKLGRQMQQINKLSAAFEAN